jgi:uncharacterized membrane protein YbhN (UPF0104 family)
MVRVALQALVSLTLIVLLVRAAQQTNLLASFSALDASAILIAACLQIIGFTLNSRRWQLLLSNAGINDRLGTLTALYFIGLFCSLFLPTGTGGDVVRAYDVARRSGRPTQAIIGTLQERLFGLGASLLVGLVATLYYLPIVPPQLRVWILLTQIVGAIGITLLIYPALLFAAADWFWRSYGHRAAPQKFAAHPLIAKSIAAVRPIAQLPPLPVPRLALILGMSIASVLMGIGSYYVLGRSLGIQAGLMVFCLVVPLVWITRMAPISLNGFGLSEGSFVFLIGLFAVPADKALALALAVLGLQTSCALFGGLLLAFRVMRGTWIRTGQPGDLSRVPMPHRESEPAAD